MLLVHGKVCSTGMLSTSFVAVAGRNSRCVCVGLLRSGCAAQRTRLRFIPMITHTVQAAIEAHNVYKSMLVHNISYSTYR